MIHRVTATEAALALVQRLKDRHGAVFFYQAGAGGDGGAPMCYAEGDMALLPDDVCLGEVMAGVLFHVSCAQGDRLVGSQLTLDVAPGSRGTFSLEEGEGVHFVSRTRLWTDEEWQALEAQEARGLLPPGPVGTAG